MAITPFENSDYEILISDLIFDIYYSELSISSRLVLLRKMTELITRRFLNLGMGEKMELGDITSPEKNPKYKTTERLNNVDKLLRKDFESTVNKLREIGNKYSHTQNHKISNLEEWIEAENLIWDLFSYLFVQYFLKYNLSLKSDKNVLSMFSQLPTDIRFRTLQKLFEIKGYDNIQLIDKYLLAMVKSKGWEEAYFWLISHRKEIQSMGYPSENEIIEYTDDFDEDELSLPLRKFQNVFGLLSSVLRNPKVKSVSGGIYDTFEEAVKYFYEENLETYLSATREQIEFRELLYFCFIGRTQTN
ncbi:hypothetical protein V528_03470 [Streptococcus thermophilus TH1436]|uniref:hypothetical protein n=1 Tax=Streptococcus thermophilus TaxID=1308 RepID=UPI0003D3C4D5|nr:hypothetical protein [Streptococcus thermophilus]ETE41657.1 hypothetical protein V528_03470 [Streptococcus thermophilus TH1436]MBO1156993.1 hypothetical protein [Streptococcus thermophilus]MBW7794394.1 hypothetical protein [Streptococcus thermophilus]MBW7812491.1 hypothetical protein [Streptococcus thermophilus]MCS9982186.1 hypothetical protein [Streptococcus thermophilus]